VVEDVVVKKFMFAISSPGEFLVIIPVIMTKWRYRTFKDVVASFQSSVFSCFFFARSK